MKNKFKKILYPNLIFATIFFIVSFTLLILIFIFHLENNFLSYAVYPCCVYSLVFFIAWMVKLIQYSKQKWKNSKYYHFYHEHFDLITKILLVCSLSINMIYGIFELITGIYFLSTWFITLAIYYLLLCFMKTFLIFSVKSKNFGENKPKEYQRLRNIGIFMLFLNVLLLGMIILIIVQNRNITYQGFLIYIVALYDFYLIINAIIRVIKYRKKSSPILMASKCINLTVAMISMISLSVALISQFGDQDDVLFKGEMITALGCVAVIINTTMSILMIVKSVQYFKNQSVEEDEVDLQALL